MWKSVKNLNVFERWLWGLSALLVSVGFFYGGKEGILSTVAALVGVSGLIFIAKGDVLGQVLTVIFSILYATVSWGFSYYGEMITYLGMSGLIALLSIFSWKRNPYAERQVKVNRLSLRAYLLLLVCTALVTLAFYFILGWLGCANLIWSTVSVTTSFSASALQLFRSPYYAIAYGLNDLVLIVLWVSMINADSSAVAMVLCFVAFLLNDLYGFYNWLRMQKRQRKDG